MANLLKNRFGKLFLSLVLAVFVIQGCGSDSDDKNSSSLPEVEHKAISTKIIHINDHHSNIAPQNLNLEIEGIEVTAETGGFARVATKINDLKREADNSLVLHAGDAISGTLFYTLFKGAADAAVMNLVGFDAMAIGNHEFDEGDLVLRNFLDRLERGISIISANVIPAAGSTLDGYIKPYTIKELEGEKVGIIGLTIKNKTQNSSSPSDDITFLDEKAAVESTVAELEALGINKIVLLSHYGYNFVQQLAAEVRGIDVIVDGDSHTLLGDFAQLGLEASGDYPTMANSSTGEPVCIVQAWQYSLVVGNLNVTFSEDGVVTECSGNPILLIGNNITARDDSALSPADELLVLNAILNSGVAEIVEENALVKSVVDIYGVEVDNMKTMVIGATSTDELLHNRIPGVTYNGVNLPLGSDIAPIVAKGFYELSLRADACIQNSGGVRISIPANTDITYDTAYTLLPFANTLYEIDMYGSEIKEVLEDAVHAAVADGSTGSFPTAYGLRFDVNAGNERGSRILNLEVKDRETGAWSNIDESKMYVIVSNSFTAQGQDGYVTFKTVQDARGQGVDTYLDYAMSFVMYVENETKSGRAITKLPAEDHPIKSYTPAP